MNLFPLFMFVEGSGGCPAGAIIHARNLKRPFFVTISNAAESDWRPLSLQPYHLAAEGAVSLQPQPPEARSSRSRVLGKAVLPAVV